MYRLLLLFSLLLVVNCCPGAGAKPPKPKAAIKTDSASVVDQRFFDQGKLAAYSKQPEFNYHEDKAGPSLWERFWRWFWHWFDFKIQPGGHLGNFWYYFFQALKWLLIAGGVGALIFLIMKLAGIDMFNIFGRKAASGTMAYSELMENIHLINFDEEVEQAVAKGNYRLAVRLLYLKSLKQLNDSGLIDWQLDKTNNTYVAEIADPEKRSAFQQLTRQFEYVWYGEFLIDQPSFQQIHLLFQQFKQQLA